MQPYIPFSAVRIQGLQRIDLSSLSRPNGERSRSSLIMGGTVFITSLISCSVVYLLSENLMEPWIAVNGIPIALRTWDGSSEPEEQAEPEEAQMPCSFSLRSIASPSIYSKLTLVVFGNLLFVSPFIRVSGHEWRRAFSRQSLRPER